MSSLTVMTRNLYVGSEFGPVLRASTLEEALAAVPLARREIEDSDFEHRAERIAREVAETGPDLVGIQEAAAVRRGPPEGGEPDEMVLDYLRLLEKALSGRGLEYEAAGEVWNIDVTMPSGLPPTEKLRLTDRDVLLARRGLHLSATTGAFDARGAMEVAGGSVSLTRGWISADVPLDGNPIRVVTTHLETSQDPGAQLAQAEELLAGPLRTSLPVVLMGDLNAQAPGAQAYRRLLAAGFLDAWTETHPDEPGFTCCQDPDLRNTGSKLYERIDLVLLRGPFVVTETRLTGGTPDGRTESGLWPSDHAGLVATIELGP